jgi:hypothetical protein
MSGISKFKRIYSEGVASEHPDIAGQPKFASKADEILARRKRNRAKSEKNAKLDAIGRRLYNMNKIREELEVNEAHWNPITKMIQDEPASKEEIEALAAKARTKKKVRKPQGSIRKTSGTFKPSSPEEAQANKASWNDYWSSAAKGYKEEYVNEKIDVGADVGATISDFVHSKSKTFKGDSKKQRIKRALGAYYAAQREETENIYNYIIETLVDADFAESYEAAENIFEHMSDEFTAVILEEYLEERKRSRTERKAANAGKKGYDKEGKPVPTGKPRVYDFDKVTADTAGTMVHIKNAEGKRVQSLNDTEFYTHHKNKELKPGHSYDYSDFDSPKVLAKNAKPIKSTIASMKRDQKRNKPVMTLTARSHKVKSGVTDFLNKHGVSASKVKQHFTGDMPSHLNTGERKAITLKHIVKNNPAGAKFTDDHPGNLESAKEVPKVKTFLAKPNKKGKVVSRSYQATKEEMSAYDYWKQFID